MNHRFHVQLPDLPAAAIRLWQQIPAGRIATYGDIARELGSPAASRWVGQFAKSHSHSASCGCHRLVRSTGELGHFVTGDVTRKRLLLAQEGSLDTAGRGDLLRCRCGDFQSDRPLQQLADDQRAAARCVSLSPPRAADRPAMRVGGVDVSYHGTVAWGTYVRLDEAGDVAWSQTLSQPVDFPYISGFLAFRELPLMAALVEEARRRDQLCDVLLVDGSGVLHPRSAGIATMLGLSANVVTVGVTKKRLCGTIVGPLDRDGEPRPVMMDGQLRGGALLPTRGARHPLYVSPGHGIDVMTAIRVVRDQCRQRRLPLPIYWADRLSRKATRQSSAA